MQTLKGAAVLVATLALVGVVVANAATMHVSQPAQVTNDTYYERGQSIVYDGANYWLFYGRSATVTGNYGNSNPDVNDYAVYYKTAASVAGLAGATAVAVPGATSSYLGETGAADFGGEVWTFATIDLGATADVFGWYYSGGGWTQVASMVSGLSVGSAHHDEISFNGELFVMVRRGTDFFTTHTATPKTGGWSAEAGVGAGGGGVARFYEEGGVLYLAAFKSGAPSTSQIFQYNSGYDTWTMIDSAASSGWDPTLFKVGTDYVFANAPWSGRQWVIGTSGPAIGSVLSTGTPINITEGRYGANTWIDMWPIGFTDAGGTSWLFYTSERDQPAAAGTGNIWVLKVDWDVSENHNTWIQEAVDAAAPGDVVQVAAGTYEEQVEIAKDLMLVGAGMGVTTIQSPATLTKFFTTGTNSNYPIVYVHDADATITELTVDGFGRGNANYRFQGIGYRNAGGAVVTCEIKNVRDTPFSGTQHGVALYLYNDDAIPRSLSVDYCDIYGFQKNGMALNTDALTPLMVGVTNNTVTGIGPTDVTAQNGIQVASALGSGDIYANTVTGIAYDNTAAVTKWVATSILNFYAELNILNNTVSNGHVGVYNIDGSSNISYNDITIEKVGVYAFGIIATDPPSAVPAPFLDSDGAPQPVGRRGNTMNALLTVTADGNTVNFSGPDNTATYGIEADAGWGPDDIAFSAQNNTVTGFEAGLEFYMCESGCDTGVFTAVKAFNNHSSGNTYNVRSNITYLTVDASGNWVGASDAATVATLVQGDVDYTPWLNDGIDTGAAPGFQGDFSFLQVDELSPQTGVMTRLEEAMGLVSGSTIFLNPGMYNIINQAHVTSDLSIIGASTASVTIRLITDTGNSGDARGWWLVDSGILFDLSNVTMDGTGVKVYQAIRHRGYGSITNVDFKNIKYNESGPDYSGVGIAAFGTGPVHVTGCNFTEIGRIGLLYFGTGVSGSMFTNNTYTGKGVGDWLDYAADISAGAVVNVSGCTIQDNLGVASLDGSTSAGLIVTTYFAAGTTSDITGSDFANNTTGIAVGYDASDSSMVTASCNSFTGNGTGVSSTAPTVDARNNWWGNATGPYHNPTNLAGLGDPVSDFVLFSPWMVATNEVEVLPALTYTNCTTNQTVDFGMDCMAGLPDEVRGFDLTFQVDNTYVSVASITEGTFLSNVGGTAFFALDNGGGSWTVSGAILGGSIGATGAGTLFSVELQPQGTNEGLSAIDITALLLRDPLNVPLPSGFVDGSIHVDCTVPTMEPIAEAQGQYYNAAPTYANFGYDDDVALDTAEYKIDAGTWVALFSGLGLPTWDDDGWMLPGFAGLSEGTHTVYFRVSDMAGNVNGEGTPDTYSWQFFKDTIAPDPPSNFVAMPGNEKTHLTWTNPTGDPSFVGVQLQRAGWRDYPQYGGSGPAYPADDNTGDFVTQTAGTFWDDNPLLPPLTPRDIYYYSAFSYDLAGNYSVFDTGAADRCTNYWLGDIDSTGTVGTSDLIVFSGTYGTIDGGPGFVPEADFGPSDDFSGFGIPLPDDVIQFEDLMIFAMNYGNVTAAGVSPWIAESDATSLGHEVSFWIRNAERQNGDGTVRIAIDLRNDAEYLKGMRLSIEYGRDNELVAVEKGSLLAGDGDKFFGTMRDGDGRIFIDIAELGQGKAFDGSGEVVRLVIRPNGANPVAVSIAEADLRDVNNQRDVIESRGRPEQFVPTISALHQNHPNPFNPTTTVTFDVAMDGNVTIQIFDISGRLVRTLMDEHRPVGRHEVVWRGRNNSGAIVTTGVYFYRMTTPGFVSQTRKMLLLK